MSLAKQLMSFFRAGSEELKERDERSCRGCKAQPGTVTEHNHHVLVRISAFKNGPESWPERVDEYVY